MNLLLRLCPGEVGGLFLANVLVQVTVVILAARLLTRRGGRWNAAWRHRVYLTALVCVLVSPLLALVMPATGLLPVRFRPAVPTASPAEALPRATAPPRALPATPTPTSLAASPGFGEVGSLGPDHPTGTPTVLAWPTFLRALGGVALLVWLLGIIGLLVRWYHGWRLIATLRRQTQPLDAAALAEPLQQVRHTLGAERLPPIALSEVLERPILVGLVRPLVILPEELLRRLPGQDLVDILVHECAHAVCRHQFVAFLQRVVSLVFWPHPLVHGLNRELTRAGEEVCDNYVLRRSAPPRYARTLLELSQWLAGTLEPTALGLFHGHWRLEDRVADLLDRRRRVMIGVSRWATAALCAALLVPALLIASIQVVQAESAAQEKTAEPAAPPATSNATAELSQPVAGKGFVAVPFTSELQRACNWSYVNAKVFVVLNGIALMKENNTVLDTRALDYEALAKVLQPLAPQGGTQGFHAYVLCPPFPGGWANLSAPSVFLGFLQQHGWHTDTGHRESNVEMVHLDSARDWSSLTAALSQPATAEEIRAEAGVGDDLVKVYPIRTPLSRFFYGDSGTNCVIRNLKPFDQFTAEDLQAFPERAKTYVAKLGLSEPPKLCFLMHCGDAFSKANRTMSQLHRDNDAWWKAQGFAITGGTLWDAGRGHQPPVLLVKVVSRESGQLVSDAQVRAEYPEEVQKYAHPRQQPAFARDKDGRWRCDTLVDSEDFTLTVQAPGYRVATQQLTLSSGETKELEVRLPAE